MTIADRVKMTREMKHWTQEDLARAIGLKDKSSIAKIEKSGDKITLKNVEKLSAALGVSIAWLMGWGKHMIDIPYQESAYSETMHPHDKDLDRLINCYKKLEDTKPLIYFAEYLVKKEEGEKK
jgi:transcriptional regulator with XRE-family HTH domain